MTYSAVYTVGDLLYGRSGITTKNSNLKNTTTFNAKFLGDRLRVMVISRINRRRKRRPRNKYVHRMHGRLMQMGKARSNILRVPIPIWQRQLIIRTI